MDATKLALKVLQNEDDRHRRNLGKRPQNHRNKMSISREYGKPLDLMVARCQNCQHPDLRLLPMEISNFILEAWPQRMDRILRECKYGCAECGTIIPAAKLQWRKM